MLLFLTTFTLLIGYTISLAYVRRQCLPTAKSVHYSPSFKVIYYLIMVTISGCLLRCAMISRQGISAEFTLFALLPFILVTGQAVMEVAHAAAANSQSPNQSSPQSL